MYGRAVHKSEAGYIAGKWNCFTTAILIKVMRCDVHSANMRHLPNSGIINLIYPEGAHQPPASR